MLLLGLDTSGKEGSIALVDCGAAASRTLALAPLEGGTFSALLVPQLAALLQQQKLTKDQLDGFAVVSGPGSFTGLRVGLAAIKGLAEILQKPVAPVSLLEAVALKPGEDGCFLAALDAGRGEVYAGTYEVRDGEATCLAEEVVTISDLVQQAGGKRVVTPDQKLAVVLEESAMSAHKVERPQADAIAWLGFRKFQEGKTVAPEALDATYIRRSEAEIKLAEREK